MYVCNEYFPCFCLLYPFCSHQDLARQERHATGSFCPFAEKMWSKVKTSNVPFFLTGQCRSDGGVFCLKT